MKPEKRVVAVLSGYPLFYKRALCSVFKNEFNDKHYGSYEFSCSYSVLLLCWWYIKQCFLTVALSPSTHF